MKTRLCLGALALLLLATSPAWTAETRPQHERLRLRNTFKNPEEVVNYYCARDASGFVWSGLLDSERTAFTLWREAPQQDLFYIAKKYEILPPKAPASHSDQVTVDVHYELTAMGDAHGTKMPPPRKDLTIAFNLRKVNGAWKISKPDAGEISPVVLEEKFPYSGR